MTYDERQEIEAYLVILEKNCTRLERSIRMLREQLDKCKLELKNNKDEPAN